MGTFLWQAGVLASLRHPNCVLFLGVTVVRPACALVTEFMAGGSVAALMSFFGSQDSLMCRQTQAGYGAMCGCPGFEGSG